MAVPKRKVSKARRDKRRSSVWKLTAPALVECPQCHEKTKGKNLRTSRKKPQVPKQKLQPKLKRPLTKKRARRL